MKQEVVVLYTVRHKTNNFTDAFHNIIQHNTQLQTLSTCYGDVILNTFIHHAQTKC